MIYGGLAPDLWPVLDASRGPDEFQSSRACCFRVKDARWHEMNVIEAETGRDSCGNQAKSGGSVYFELKEKVPIGSDAELPAAQIIFLTEDRTRECF